MARILVVEDEKDLQEVLSYNLREAGHPDRGAATGGTASRQSPAPPRPGAARPHAPGRLRHRDVPALKGDRDDQGRPHRHGDRQGRRDRPRRRLRARRRRLRRQALQRARAAAAHRRRPPSRLSQPTRARRARVRRAARRSGRPPRLGRRRGGRRSPRSSSSSSSRSSIAAIACRRADPPQRRLGRSTRDIDDAHRRHARQAAAREARQRGARTSRRCAASATASRPRPITPPPRATAGPATTSHEAQHPRQAVRGVAGIDRRLRAGRRALPAAGRRGEPAPANPRQSVRPPRARRARGQRPAQYSSGSTGTRWPTSSARGHTGG